MTARLMLLIAVLACAAGGCGVRDRVHQSTKRATCQNNLLQLGALHAIQDLSGELTSASGPDFFLQFRDKLSTEDLEVLFCPYDRDRAAACSYVGPSAETVGWLRSPKEGRKGRGSRIVAACPHHRDGVVVLWDSTKVGFLEWDGIEGGDGDTVVFGPDAPDPRFRHLAAFSAPQRRPGRELPAWIWLAPLALIAAVVVIVVVSRSPRRASAD